MSAHPPGSNEQEKKELHNKVQAALDLINSTDDAQKKLGQQKYLEAREEATKKFFTIKQSSDPTQKGGFKIMTKSEADKDPSPPFDPITMAGTPTPKPKNQEDRNKNKDKLTLYNIMFSVGTAMGALMHDAIKEGGKGTKKAIGGIVNGAICAIRGDTEGAKEGAKDFLRGLGDIVTLGFGSRDDIGNKFKEWMGNVTGANTNTSAGVSPTSEEASSQHKVKHESDLKHVDDLKNAGEQLAQNKVTPLSGGPGITPQADASTDAAPGLGGLVSGADPALGAGSKRRLDKPKTEVPPPSPPTPRP